MRVPVCHKIENGTCTYREGSSLRAPLDHANVDRITPLLPRMPHSLSLSISFVCIYPDCRSVDVRRRDPRIPGRQYLLPRELRQVHMHMLCCVLMI